MHQDGTATCTGDKTYDGGGWSQTKTELEVGFTVYSSVGMNGLLLHIVFDDYHHPVSGSGTANVWWYQYSIGREGGSYLKLRMTR